MYLNLKVGNEVVELKHLDFLKYYVDTQTLLIVYESRVVVAINYPPAGKDAHIVADFLREVEEAHDRLGGE